MDEKSNLIRSLAHSPTHSLAHSHTYIGTLAIVEQLERPHRKLVRCGRVHFNAIGVTKAEAWVGSIPIAPHCNDNNSIKKALKC